MSFILKIHQKRLACQDADKKWVSTFLAPISEHGTLFSCDIKEPKGNSKKKTKTRLIDYWVVGRIYPDDRELYICFQDELGVPNLLETAFKLAFFASK